VSDPLAEFAADMRRLRAECAWKSEQTHESLRRYLVEESWETLEAIDSGDPEHLREELGDLLLQVVFHARLADEDPDDPWDIDDVARDICAKLVRRHPHVFAVPPGDLVADRPDAAAVEARWEQDKSQEKGRTSVFDGVPRLWKISNTSSLSTSLRACSTAFGGL